MTKYVIGLVMILSVFNMINTEVKKWKIAREAIPIFITLYKSNHDDSLRCISEYDTSAEHDAPAGPAITTLADVQVLSLQGLNLCMTEVNKITGTLGFGAAETLYVPPKAALAYEAAKENTTQDNNAQRCSDVVEEVQRICPILMQSYRKKRP